MITSPNTGFYADVMRGLKAPQKYLESKYFYDEQGDGLFQQIMASPEYYLTNSELEILQENGKEILELVHDFGDGFDLIELGAGDAMKSSYLLQYFTRAKQAFTYYPIDISGHVIRLLEEKLPREIPGIRIKGLEGEYFEMLKKAAGLSKRPKLVLFLGSNIGNMYPHQAAKFCASLHAHLSPGDRVLIGFDLKKNPYTILAAYSDRAGITRQFNLNLLRRMNLELDADFDLEKFEHYATYDPATGSCKSFLFSLSNQEVHFGQQETISFKKDECIFMEVSQKYSLDDIDHLASETNFKPITHFTDHKQRFVDVVWERN